MTDELRDYWTEGPGSESLRSPGWLARWHADFRAGFDRFLADATVRLPPCEVCGFSAWPVGGMAAARSIHIREHERAAETVFSFKAVGPIGSATLPPGTPSPFTYPHPPEPSADDCTANTRGTWDGRPTMALWYPRMGGYAGFAVAVLDEPCVDVYVWHDGEFPFTRADPYRGREPALLHHCDPDQFIRLGQLLDAFVDSEADDGRRELRARGDPP